MLKTLSIILLIFSNFSYAETNLKMYSCIENKNKLYVSFNLNNKTAMVGMGEQKKYFIQIDFIYWDTVSYQNNDTLLSSIIFSTILFGGFEIINQLTAKYHSVSEKS